MSKERILNNAAPFSIYMKLLSLKGLLPKEDTHPTAIFLKTNSEPHHFNVKSEMGLIEHIFRKSHSYCIDEAKVIKDEIEQFKIYDGSSRGHVRHYQILLLHCK